MGENSDVKKLFRDALSGNLSSREIFKRGIALGLSSNVIRMLAMSAKNITAQPSAAPESEGD